MAKKKEISLDEAQKMNWLIKINQNESKGIADPKLMAFMNGGSIEQWEAQQLKELNKINREIIKKKEIENGNN
jgi:hypothetical protein